MKKRVYIETTIVSYLTGKPSRDLIAVAHQEITRDWWERSREEFDLYVSQYVLDEAARGDPAAARQRLMAIQDAALLPTTPTAVGLAEQLITRGLLPEKASADAMHLAMATVHRTDFLLTWNCRHLANAQLMREISRFVGIIGYEMPNVCTPEELMRYEEDDDA